MPTEREVLVLGIRKRKKMEKDKSFNSKVLNLVEYNTLHLFSILQFIKFLDIGSLFTPTTVLRNNLH